MGEVRTEITLVNSREQNVADGGYIPQEQVRRLTVNAVVDTGATTLIINEEIREKLGLRVKRSGEAGRKPMAFASEFATQTPTVAGGGKVQTQLTETVDVYWKDRETSCRAVVLPGEKDVLLGALPGDLRSLEGMDLTINPLRNEVTGAHGDAIHIVIK